MANPIKDYYLNQYAGATSGLNQPVSYLDSPVFQSGLEKWEPTGMASLVAKNIAMPIQNFASKLTGSGDVTHGLAGYGTGAAFRELPKNATEIQKQEWAQPFGHEISHLGWEYESPLKNIAAKAEAVSLPKSLQDIIPGVSGKYKGEEQWNYLHDQMYGPKVDYKQNMEDLKKTYEKFPKGSPERKTAFNEAMKKINTDQYLYGPTTAEDYLTKHELVNPGDLSYTPYAHDVISKSGLIPEHKKAIGFGINPFEDTKAAGQWYAMQKYKNMSKAKKQQNFQNIIKAAEEKKAAEAAAAAAAAAKYTAPRHHQDVSRNRGDHTAPTFRNIKDEGPGVTASSGMHGGKHYADGGLINFYRYGGFI